MKVALCVIATGKYTRFLPGLLASAGRFFCAGHNVRCFVFSDEAGEPWRVARRGIRLQSHYPLRITLRPAKHEPWPGPTLHRYRTMLQAAADLLDCDYVYYVDVDSRFVRPVGAEIFGEVVATIHYGFCDSPRREFTYEYHTTSRAYVRPREGKRYYCGGFQGGRAGPYLQAMQTMDAAIADDERRGIVAWWHDESHWNRYLIDHPPTLELSHEYCCPEPWRPETQRIVIVGENSHDVRSS